MWAGFVSQPSGTRFWAVWELRQVSASPRFQKCHRPPENRGWKPPSVCRASARLQQKGPSCEPARRCGAGASFAGLHERKPRANACRLSSSRSVLDLQRKGCEQGEKPAWVAVSAEGLKTRYHQRGGGLDVRTQRGTAGELVCYSRSQVLHTCVSPVSPVRGVYPPVRDTGSVCGQVEQQRH